MAPRLGFNGEQDPSGIHFASGIQTAGPGGFRDSAPGWAREELGERAQAVDIEGKSLRGIHGRELPGVHLVALYGQQPGLILAQNEGRGEGGGVERGSVTVGPGWSGWPGGDWGRPVCPGPTNTRRRCDTTATSLWRRWPFSEFPLLENRKTLAAPPAKWRGNQAHAIIRHRWRNCLFSACP